MTSSKILLPIALILCLASCNTEQKATLTERETLNDSMATSEIKPADTGIKPVDHIPPIGIGQSSGIKRERKFYIR